MMADETRTTNIRVPKDMWDEAEAEAERLGLLMSSYIRMALRRQIQFDQSQGAQSGR